MDRRTQKEPSGGYSMKMVFHFVRVPDSDIPVEGATISECTQKAFDERMKQVTPTSIKGEVFNE